MSKTLPNVPAYYASPEMEYDAAQKLQVLFDAKLGWLQLSYHIAKIGVDAEKKLNYPQIYANNNTNTHFSLHPDNKVKSYSFIEVDKPYRIDAVNGEITYYFSAVFWCNLPLIDATKTYDYSGELINDVIQELIGVEAQDIDVEVRPGEIFKKYSGLKQETDQFVMRRYSAFKMSFSINQQITDCGATSVNTCTQNADRINALDAAVKVCVLTAITGNEIQVVNSDETYNETQSYPGPHNLPDVQHTNSDGSPETLPGMTAMVCTPQAKDLQTVFAFVDSSEDNYTRTISANEAGTYTAATTTNVDTLAWEKNGQAATLPITVAANDTLKATITRTAIGEATVTLTGTYI